MKKRSSLIAGLTTAACTAMIASVGSSYAFAGQDTTYAAHETISIGYPGNGSSIKVNPNDPVLNYIEKKFNISFKLVTETWANMDQQTNLWGASGQLPDVFFSDQLNNTTYDQWVQQGLIQPLPSNLSKYPYLQKLENLPDVKSFAVNGKMYLVPRLLQQQNVLPSDFGVVVRKDWMDKLHLSQPKTWNDFMNILKAFVTKNPDHQKNVVGFTTGNVGWTQNDLFVNQFPQRMWWYKDHGKWIAPITSPKYLTIINELHQMYASGLLDKDWANPNNNASTKFVNGQAGAMDQQAKTLNGLEQAWNAAHPKEPFNQYVEFLMMPPGPDGNRYQYVYYNWWSESLFNSQVDATKMDRIMALYNWLLSPQGRVLTNFGIEGKDYKLVNGKIASLRPASWNINTAYPITGMISQLAVWGEAEREGFNEFNTVNPVPNGWTKMSNDMLQNYINEYMKITKPTQINWDVNAYASSLPPVTAGGSSDTVLAQAVASNNPAQVWNKFVQAQLAGGLAKEIQEVNQQFKNANN